MDVPWRASIKVLSIFADCWHSSPAVKLFDVSLKSDMVFNFIKKNCKFMFDVIQIRRSVLQDFFENFPPSNDLRTILHFVRQTKRKKTETRNIENVRFLFHFLLVETRWLCYIFLCWRDFEPLETFVCFLRELLHMFPWFNFIDLWHEFTLKCLVLFIFPFRAQK